MLSRFVAPPVGAGHNPLTFPDGTTFSAAAGATVDADEAKYHDCLESAGWLFLATAGTLAERPKVSALPRLRGRGPNGYPYIASDLNGGEILLWDATNKVWRNAAGADVDAPV